MLVGYARVSTHEQNLDMQNDALKKAGCGKIFIDKVSSVAASRPGIEEALSYLREGDTLIVWRLDRLGRSLKHLIQMVGAFEEKKIGFQSIQEAINTAQSGGKLIFHMFGALAEFERQLIVERTLAGLDAARARGKKGGRPKALNEKERDLAVRLYNERKNSVMEICQILKISKPTLYNYVHQANTQQT